MDQSLRVSSGPACLDLHAQVSTAGVEPRQSVLTTAVGASYAFDPGVDGLVSIYAARVLERGIDPRVLCAEIRADRLGLVDRRPQRRALMARTHTSRFGRGTAVHLRSQASPIQLSPESKSSPEKGLDRLAHQISRPHHCFQISWSRKLAAAGLAALLLLPIGVIVANAQDAPLQPRYVVQPGDTLERVAAGFGVAPAAILATSAIQNPPLLAPDKIIVIPDPSESPEAAAWTAS
jgi:LysM repeat protein